MGCLGVADFLSLRSLGTKETLLALLAELAELADHAVLPWLTLEPLYGFISFFTDLQLNRQKKKSL